MEYLEFDLQKVISNKSKNIHILNKVLIALKIAEGLQYMHS